MCHLQVFDGRSFALGGTNSARFVPVPTAGAPGAPSSDWNSGASEMPWSAGGRSDGRFPGGMHSDRCERAQTEACEVQWLSSRDASRAC